MSSNPLRPCLFLEPSLTFQPDEIDNLFLGDPPAARRHAPEVLVEVELYQANSTAVAPAIDPPPRHP